MIRSNYEHFLRIEQLIYKQRDKADHVTEIIAPVAVAKEDDDVFSKIEKLASLKERNLISAEEYEKKKAELLSQI